MFLNLLMECNVQNGCNNEQACGKNSQPQEEIIGVHKSRFRSS